MSNVPPGFPPGFPFPAAPAPQAQYQQPQYAPPGPQYPPQAQYQQPPTYGGGNSVVDDIINATLGAESSEGGNRFRHGKYLVLVEAIVYKKGNKGPLFIPEFYVEQSQAVNMIDPNTGLTAVPNAPGESVGAVHKMNDKPAASNARGFVLSILQKQENKNDHELTQLIGQKMKQWAQPGQPLRGLPLLIETYEHVIQSGANAGKKMVRLKYKMVPGTTAEMVKAYRAKLDAVAAGQAQAVAAQPTPQVQAQAPQAPATPAPQAPAPAANPFAGIL